MVARAAPAEMDLPDCAPVSLHIKECANSTIQWLISRYLFGLAALCFGVEREKAA